MSISGKMAARDFRKKYSILKPTLEEMRSIIQSQGCTIVEFNAIFNDEDVALIHEKMQKDLREVGGGIDAIYYCLGFEQILGGAGGIGSKVLTSAFKTAIEDKGEPLTVTESGAYLEISNGIEIRTIYRNIKSESKDNHLVTVYYGNWKL